MVPAMNVRMWNHPATRRNLATLGADGVRFVGPEVGDMACGETGPGRMAEPATICEAILEALAPARGPLAGQRAIVTAGPTAEPIDPVRVLTNRSSGKQGFAIAGALAALGAEVVLVAGPVSEPTPAGVRRVDVETAREMLAACEAALPADIAVCVAAVADWRPAEVSAGKTKKVSGAAPPEIRLVENPDILATLSRRADRPALVVGFAAETETVEAQAQAKRVRKGVPLMVGNLGPATFGLDDNALLVIDEHGTQELPRASKLTLARQLMAEIASRISTKEQV
jgi:phosphopantothenoylcysteine decarboxylase/phosphopantothenate--cysteine ligase